MSIGFVFYASEAKTKHCPNSYQLYCAQMRNQGVKGICQKSWRAMDKTEREMWNTKASIAKDAIKRGDPIPLYVLPGKPTNMAEAQRVAIEGEVWRTMSMWFKKEHAQPNVLNKMPLSRCIIGKIGKQTHKRSVVSV